MTSDHTDAPVVLDDENAGRLSRFLALVLRHRAHQFELPVSDEGFVPIAELLEFMHDRQRSLDWVEESHLHQLAERGERKRFEVRDGAIRATYGHSFNRPIRYEPVDPPEELFYGYPKSKLPQLRQTGLKPHGRAYVHLSLDRDEALEVGLHSAPDATVITVRAKEAAKQGTAFHNPAEGLFLVEQVRPEHLDIELGFGRKPRKRRR